MAKNLSFVVTLHAKTAKYCSWINLSVGALSSYRSIHELLDIALGLANVD
jgi:hypothetical protein